MQAEYIAGRCCANIYCKTPRRTRYSPPDEIHCSQCNEKVHEECTVFSDEPNQEGESILCLRCSTTNNDYDVFIVENFGHGNDIIEQEEQQTTGAQPEDESNWIMPSRDEYMPYLVDLMNFFDSPSWPYTKNTKFTRAQLLRLNPTVIQRWMARKAYGKEEYDPAVDKPIAKKSTIEYAKKAVSYFMPNRSVAWENGSGNPTRHSCIHEIIKHVKTAQTWRAGVVNRVEDQLAIDKPVTVGDDGNLETDGDDGNAQVVGGSTHEMLQGIQVQLKRLEQIMNNNAARWEANFANLMAYMQHRDRALNNNICAFGGTAIQGALGVQGVQGAYAGQRLQHLGRNNSNVAPAQAATLSANPKSLEELWQEYHFGIAGRKPACRFTPAERNNRANGLKQKYYRRRQVWDVIKRQIENGHTADAAIRKIRDVYGPDTSVTKIIDAIIRDKKRYDGGFHPNLS